MKWHQPLAGTGAISVQGETARALWKGGEWRESVRIGFAAQHSGHGTVQEGHTLTAGAGGVRAEGGCRHTVSDFILHSPGYALAALQRHLYEIEKPSAVCEAEGIAGAVPDEKSNFQAAV